MKLTIWEKSVLESAVGSINGGSIDRIRKLLALRDKLDLTAKQQKAVDNKDDQAVGEVVEIDVDDQELGILHQLMSSDKIAFPVDRRTLDLHDKIEQANKTDEDDGKNE